MSKHTEICYCNEFAHKIGEQVYAPLKKKNPLSESMGKN